MLEDVDKRLTEPWLRSLCMHLGGEALKALGAFRVLCAHRRGPHGVATWMAQIEDWLAREIANFGAEGSWYGGRPLLATENDYGLRLYNGDTGFVISTGPGRVSAAFECRGQIVEFSPNMLAAVDTLYAMTIHKSQGSQFDTTVVLMPLPTRRLSQETCHCQSHSGLGR